MTEHVFYQNVCSVSKKLGVYGDLGPTVPGPETAEDLPPRD